MVRSAATPRVSNHEASARGPAPDPPKAMDSRKLRRKRPFPYPPISLIRDLHRFKKPHEPDANHPRTRRQPRAEARRICAHSQADRPGAELHGTRDFLGDVERALLVQILA